MTTTENHMDDRGEEPLTELMAAVQKIVGQCRAHVVSAFGKLGTRLSEASKASPSGLDVESSRGGNHTPAFRHRHEAIETLSNAVIVHLSTLEVLLTNDTIYTLSMVPIARSLAEAAANTRWLIEPGLDTDARNARAYASMFHALARHEPLIDGAVEQRDELKVAIQAAGGRVHPRYRETQQTLNVWDSDGNEIQVKQLFKEATDDVGSVRLGGHTARTGFKYAQRIKEQIPTIDLYSQMSMLTHGDHTALPVAWDNPGSVLRMTAFVARAATEAWSEAIHAWTGAEYEASIVAEAPWETMIESIPHDVRRRLASARDDVRKGEPQQSRPGDSFRRR